MPISAPRESPTTSDRQTLQIEEAILDHLHQEDVLGLDALVALLPQVGWNQIFHAVDRLARTGKIVLRRHGFDYTLFSTRYVS